MDTMLIEDYSGWEPRDVPLLLDGEREDAMREADMAMRQRILAALGRRGPWDNALCRMNPETWTLDFGVSRGDKRLGWMLAIEPSWIGARADEVTSRVMEWFDHNWARGQPDTCLVPVLRAYRGPMTALLARCPDD